MKYTAMIARLTMDRFGFKFLFYCWFVSFIGLATIIVTDLRPESDLGIRFIVIALPTFVIWLFYKIAYKSAEREVSKSEDSTVDEA